MATERGGEAPVAVVLAGAGARGAYEAGFLAGLLPALEDVGRRPSLFLGTSAGAINAALFASLAHLPAARAAAVALERWRSVRWRSVIGPVLPAVARAGLGYATAVAGAPPAPSALLDAGPLRRTLNSSVLMDWPQLHENVRRGRVGALAVVTTECRTRRTTVFVESSTPDPARPSDPLRAIDYPVSPVTADHVLASSAIPAAFPPVRLSGGSAGDGWHMDGGVRLNTPLKPALALGAGRLVVLSTGPRRYESAAAAPPTAGTAPAVQGVLAQVVRGVLHDRMIEDLLTLDRTNRLVAGGARSVTTRSGRRTYRRVPYLFGGPATSDTISDLAAAVAARRLRGAGVLVRPELAAFRVLLGSDRASQGELLSYLLFDDGFVDEAIALGERDAAILTAEGLPWCGED